MFRTKFVENIKTRILCSNPFFPQGDRVVRDNVEERGTDDSITRRMRSAC